MLPQRPQDTLTGITYSPELTLYRPKGCPQCNNSGYKGRMGVHELLVGTDEMKRAIQQKAGIDEMRRLAMQQSMRTLLQDAIEKAFKGVTDVKQARAIAVKYGVLRRFRRPIYKTILVLFLLLS